MGLCRRPLVRLIWLFLLLVFIVGSCHGSRVTNVFKFKPKSQYSGHFLGFLPRRIPIPASGPSRKHNDIGLKSYRSPWRSQFLDKRWPPFLLLFFFFLHGIFFINQRRVGGRCTWGSWWLILSWRLDDNVFFLFRRCNIGSVLFLHYTQGEAPVGLILIFFFFFWVCIKCRQWTAWQKF